MEQLQAIVSLRAGGYNQSLLNTWFQEPTGWLKTRVRDHESIRDELLKIFNSAGFPVFKPQGGSYLFPQLPPLALELTLFIRLLRHQAGVTVTPGLEFGPSTENCIRLNFSQNLGNAIAAVERIVKLVERYRE